MVSLLFLVLISSCWAQQSYFIDSRENCNNVYGALSTPDNSTEWVEYLGLFVDTYECIQACLNISTDTHRCESYTYYTKEFNGSIGSGRYQWHCYGRFGSPYGLLWTPVPENAVNCGRIIYKCTSDMDCSLNGKCDTISGNCTCRAAWSGYHCQQLNLLPAIKGTGYHINDDEGSGKPTSSWGIILYIFSFLSYLLHILRT